MAKVNTLTVISIVFLATSVTLSFVTMSGQMRQPGISKQKTPKRDGEGVNFRKQFPLVEFADNTPAEDVEKRKEKNKRYDNYGFVKKQASAEITESVREYRWQDQVPALPTDQSAVIVVGTIQSVKAYLSNDKSGVYTEVNVSIDELLKNNSSESLAVGKTLSADRPGGTVRYQDGSARLYRIFGMNIPEVNHRYVLFLSRQDNSPNYVIITGYELTPAGVMPLDVAPQFNEHQGTDETTFLRELRTTLNRQ